MVIIAISLLMASADGPPPYPTALQCAGLSMAWSDREADALRGRLRGKISRCNKELDATPLKRRRRQRADGYRLPTRRAIRGRSSRSPFLVPFLAVIARAMPAV